MKEEVKARKQGVFGSVGVIMVAIFALVLAGAIDTAEARGGYKRFCDAGKKWYKQYHKKHKKHYETISPVCGDTIEGNGRHLRLKADLDCSHLEIGVDADHGFEAALTIVGPVTLDLRGRSIIGNAELDGAKVPKLGEIDGILVLGENAKIRRGKVTGCFNGVVLEGDGNHKILKMKIEKNNHRGFEVLSDNNRLTLNRAIDNGDNGFYFKGNNNWFVKNRAVDNGDEGFFGYKTADLNKIYLNRAIGNAEDGIQVVGNENRVIHNLAKENGYDGPSGYTFDGFEIDGDLNFVYKNRSFNNSHNGFEVDGRENKILKNKAKQNIQNGIIVEDKSDTVDNVISRNILKENAGYDIFVAKPATANATAIATATAEAIDSCGDQMWQRNRFDTCNMDCVQ